MKPKPLILIDSLIVGGPGRGIFQLLRRLRRWEVDFVLCHFSYAKAGSQEFAEEANRNGIKLFRLHELFKLDITLVCQLLRIARQQKCNLIQSHGYKSHLFAAVAAAILKLPWIAFAHGWTSEDWKVRLYHRLDSILLKQATHVVAVSPQLKAFFSKLRGASKGTSLILNAVELPLSSDEGKRLEVRHDCGIQGDELLIGCFGRLSFEKGQERLLRAFAAAQTKLPGARLLFLGSGKDLNFLKILSQRLKIETRVSFKPHTTCISDYYQSIDLLVLPSLSEGLPNVILEAMSFAVPVIATRVGALQEVVNHDNNGWLVDGEREPELSDLLIKVLSDRARLREIGLAGRDSLFPKFCAERRAEKIFELYSRVLQPVGKAALKQQAPAL